MILLCFFLLLLLLFGCCCCCCLVVVKGWKYIPDSIEHFLPGGKITNLGLSYLSSKPYLRRMDITFLDQIRDDGIAHLPHSLRHLDLVCERGGKSECVVVCACEYAWVKRKKGVQTRQPLHA